MIMEDRDTSDENHMSSGEEDEKNSQNKEGSENLDVIEELNEDSDRDSLRKSRAKKSPSDQAKILKQDDTLKLLGTIG